MRKALDKVRELKQRYANVVVMDKGRASTPTCWRRGS
jgi:hypothetical protein